MVSIRVQDLRLIYKVRQKISLAHSSNPLTSAGSKIDGSGSNRYVTALDGITFELNAGDRLGLVGPNGAGKTTLLKLLYGIYQPTSGVIQINGTVDALFNINLGFRPEATGRRNIELRGLICGWTNIEIRERMEDIIEFSELGEFIDIPFKTYSQGMAARLAFSVATSFQPEILLMDEWIGAGDQAFQEKARKRLVQLTERAGIVVLASHNKTLLNKMCKTIMTMDGGKCINVYKTE